MCNCLVDTSERFTLANRRDEFLANAQVEGGASQSVLSAVNAFLIQTISRWRVLRTNAIGKASELFRRSVQSSKLPVMESGASFVSLQLVQSKGQWACLLRSVRQGRDKRCSSIHVHGSQSVEASSGSSIGSGVRFRAFANVTTISVQCSGFRHRATLCWNQNRTPLHRAKAAAHSSCCSVVVSLCADSFLPFPAISSSNCAFSLAQGTFRALLLCIHGP